MDVKITQNIPLNRISDLIIDALEGGSNYWYMITKEIKPIVWEFENDNGERFKEMGKHWIQDYPLNPNGALIIDSIEDEEYKAMRLDLDAIKKGLQIMAEKDPQEFGNFLAEEEDGNTADVFLQCCLLGDVIYG